MSKKKVQKKEVSQARFETINIKAPTKQRFSTKFKQYKETDDAAMIRLMDIAGVSQ